MKASWPCTQTSDEVVRKSLGYLLDACHSFRIRLKNYLTQQAKSGNKNAKATHAIIYVAKKFPSWQAITIETMHQLYLENNFVLPENSLIAQRLSKLPDSKKFVKKVMPFVETRRTMLKTQGVQIFNQTSPFDELSLLVNNETYLLNTLDLEGVEIRYADEGDAKVQEDCCPLEPYIVFKKEPCIIVHAICNQAYRPFFNTCVPIYDKDTVEILSSRIIKDIRYIKGK
jgi:leucyl-tRNA synthetase, cytoplasmic